MTRNQKLANDAIAELDVMQQRLAHISRLFMIVDEELSAAIDRATEAVRECAMLAYGSHFTSLNE